MRNRFVAWLLMASIIFSAFFSSLGLNIEASAATGPNLAAGKSVTASGYADVYVASNVVDQNQGTYWESTNNAFPQWIQISLGSSVNVAQVVLKLPASWETRTQTLSIQGSANGTDFFNIVNSAAYTFNPSTGNSVSIDFPTTNTQYVRVLFTANTGWPAAQLSELEVYGASAPTAKPIPAKLKLKIGMPCQAYRRSPPPILAVA
ncbi:discoidin domain-containing protein [Paenibacillus sp. D2_2]|uniref:discoidin domain-containing protein n=1 Tax=Paenibacillus sp. D2_2 TaxID=3073092 RepID=UPI002815FB95|nr:discoidin domain-containing protein [Paenibacillus sp. D2_2]WMT41869.1 discoidin domain-containing protein [Paenibacillus sp. D2_2]